MEGGDSQYDVVSQFDLDVDIEFERQEQEKTAWIGVACHCPLQTKKAPENDVSVQCTVLYCSFVN